MGKFLVLACVFLFPSFFLCGQSVCSGNLGENIFTEGDFGSGTPNIVVTDPGIAPGYTYTTSPPPSDGYYLITNDLGRWTNIYNDWFKPQDNSNDPNGYMMVVNADYTPGVFYTQEVNDLCENTLYEFSADVLNIDRIELSGRILPNVSFLINGEVKYTTGDVQNDEKWHSYGFTFTTGPGEFSVELSLVNNAPGGLGNDLAIDNISFRPCGPEAVIVPLENINICEDGDPIDLTATFDGNPYPNTYIQWQQSSDEGRSWQNISGATNEFYTHDIKTAGDYYYRFLVAGSEMGINNSKCRVVSDVKIVTVVPKFYTVRDSICEGLSYEQAENTYTTTGIYTDTLISSIGCDSIVTLDLTIVPDTDITSDIHTYITSCSYTTDGRIELDNISNLTDPSEIILLDSDQDTMPAFNGLAAGQYYLILRDRYGCSLEEEITINSAAPFELDVGPDQEVQLGDEVIIEVDATYDIMDYTWLPGIVSCTSNCPSGSFIAVEDVSLILEASNANGCKASDTINISVDQNVPVYYPNVFSPNEDGRNEVFYLSGPPNAILGIDEMVIFNRWGGIVYRGTRLVPNSIQHGWNGKVGDQVVQSGVYTFIAKVSLLSGPQIIIKDAITLIR